MVLEDNELLVTYDTSKANDDEVLIEIVKKPGFTARAVTGQSEIQRQITLRCPQVLQYRITRDKR
jgi:hypothetical protein